MSRLLTILMLIALLAACKREPRPSLLTDTDEGYGSITDQSIDLADIEQAGELIAVTVNGPDTYYEYRNKGMGLQFLLAEAFANSLGLRLRIEVAKDTAEMVAMLKEGRADLIACELPRELLKKNDVYACGANSEKGSWAVRKTSPELCAELDSWYGEPKRAEVLASMHNVSTNRFRQQRSQAVFYSKKSGIVSTYDALFFRASRMTGWDWKLLASQCYQESGFDPNAISWAGARGLMQIMPSTASGMGVSPDNLFDPETNIMTAARLINKLEGRFANIANPTERKKFVLAAYNGGYGHISDAMALTKKYGKNPYRWSDVSYFVLHLSEPHYYKDPVVKYGYMIGSETYHYVDAVMNRWTGYNSVLHNAMPKGVDLADYDNKERKNNRFSKQQNIVSKDDSLFHVKR